MSNSKPDVLSIVGAVSASAAAILLLRRALRNDGRIPELTLPEGSWFSVQALFKLGRDNVNYGTGRWILQRCDPKIGICTRSILGQETVLLRDPALVQEVMKENHQAGGGYGKSFKGSPFDPLIDTTFGRGLFFAEDQDAEWYHAHKILSRAFSHKSILSMVPQMCEQADKLVSALQQDAAGGNALFLYDYMVKMALDTIAVCSMGTRFNSFDSKSQHQFPVAFQDAMDGLFDLFKMPAGLWWMCFWTKARLKRAVHRLNSIIDDVIQKRLRKETKSLGNQPDLLEIMLEGKDGSRLSKENIRAQILTFLFAGHDSTAAAMSSLVVFLIANPDVEAKLVAEIENVVGSAELAAGHLSELTYLEWCLKETMRLLPPAGNIQRMSFQNDIMLGGRWKLKQYTPIIVDMFALHNDPETWGQDSAVFKPERWAKGAPHQFSYMPFATGPRGCIGKEFSLMEQKIVAVKLLQRFAMRCPTTWSPRKGSVIIKASDPMPHTKLGIDAEFNPLQFFAGAGMPVLLRARTDTLAAHGGA